MSRPSRPPQRDPCLIPDLRPSSSLSYRIRTLTHDHSLSFIQGFLLGQISVALLIFAFIKFFIFGEVPEHPSSRPRSGSTHSASRLQPKKSTSALRPVPTFSSASILSKTYYNVHAHQPESVDWFNVLIAQTIAQLRNDAQQDNAILTTLNNVLNGELRPDFLAEIRVTEINLGEEFPIFSNCRIIPVEDNADFGGSPGIDGSRLQARMDVDLADNITLGIETKLILNYPKPLVAVMPVALAVSVVRFSGTLSISFIPSPSNSDGEAVVDDFRSYIGREMPGLGSSIPPSPTLLTFSFQPDYRLELSTRSLLGSRSRLQDVPKIAQLVEARLHAWFDERCVEPRFQRVVLPSLWPRKQNAGTRDSNEEAIIEGSKRHASATFSKDDGTRDQVRRRRTRPSMDSTTYPPEHLHLSQPAAFELPGNMPGSLPS